MDEEKKPCKNLNEDGTCEAASDVVTLRCAHSWPPNFCSIKKKRKETMKDFIKRMESSSLVENAYKKETNMDKKEFEQILDSLKEVLKEEREIIDYDILTNEDRYSLSQRIRSLSKDGYVPKGGVAIGREPTYRGDKTVFAQAMVKYKK